MSLTIKAPGAQRLADTIDQAADQVGDLTDASRAAATDVLGFVKPPVATGRLRDSVGADIDAHGFTLHAGSQAAPYAPFVHARDPFLTRAMKARQDAATARYEDAAQEALNTITGD